jgi:hypothetical protein
VRSVCLAFPGAEEKLSHGAPAFHVRGKLFLTFQDDHHGDGRVAVWCKASLAEQARLVAEDPRRRFVPPYVGVKGWVGVVVGGAGTDWIGLSLVIEEAWRSVAPPRLLRGESVQAPPSPPARSPRVTTDAATAHRALERLTAICLRLPEAVREKESRHATFRVRKKVFAYFLDNHHGDGFIAACFKGDRRKNAALVRDDPDRFFAPAYIGPRGWVGMRVDRPRVDWKEVADRVLDSYRAVAPQALAKLTA